MTPEEFLLASWVERNGALTGRYREGSFEVWEYRVSYDSYFYAYRVYYRYRRFTWTTPAGEVRPCSQDTRLLVGVTCAGGRSDLGP
jgi:hypothetical protein